jgi:hypothetical protein
MALRQGIEELRADRRWHDRAAVRAPRCIYWLCLPRFDSDSGFAAPW